MPPARISDAIELQGVSPRLAWQLQISIRPGPLPLPGLSGRASPYPLLAAYRYGKQLANAEPSRISLD